MMISELIKRISQRISWMHYWHLMALFVGLGHGATEGILVLILWQLIQLNEKG